MATYEEALADMAINKSYWSIGGQRDQLIYRWSGVRLEHTAVENIRGDDHSGGWIYALHIGANIRERSDWHKWEGGK